MIKEKLTADVTKEIVRTLVVDAVNNGSRRDANRPQIIHHCGTRFDLTHKNKIVVNDKKLNLRMVLSQVGDDWSLEFLRNNERKVRKLMNSKRWESAVNRIHANLPQ